MAELVAESGIEGLPLAAGHCRLSALPRRLLAVVTRPGDGVRIGIGQWLVEGEGGVDVSDAFVGLAVEGADAAEVLARLLPVDLAAGLPVRTLLRHTPVLVRARADGFGLLVPRSCAASAVADVTAAMWAVAARREAQNARG